MIFVQEAVVHGKEVADKAIEIHEVGQTGKYMEIHITQILHRSFGSFRFTPGQTELG